MYKGINLVSNIFCLIHIFSNKFLNYWVIKLKSLQTNLKLNTDIHYEIQDK